MLEARASKSRVPKLELGNQPSRAEKTLPYSNNERLPFDSMPMRYHCMRCSSEVASVVSVELNLGSSPALRPQEIGAALDGLAFHIDLSYREKSCFFLRCC